MDHKARKDPYGNADVDFQALSHRSGSVYYTARRRWAVSSETQRHLVTSREAHSAGEVAVFLAEADQCIREQAVWLPGFADTVRPRLPPTLTFDRLSLKLACKSPVAYPEIVCRGAGL